MRKLSILFLVCLILLLLNPYGFSQEERTYPCHRLIKEPVLDGNLDESSWKDIPESDDFFVLGSTSPASKRAFFKMGFSPEGLYLGIKYEEPDMEKISAILKDGNESLWAEDSVEIFIFPKEAVNYYQLIVNAIGSRCSWEGYVARKVPFGSWQARTHRGEGYWSAEIKIPFSIFYAIPREKGEVWTGNICRNNLTGSGDKFSTWVCLQEGGFHQIEKFGRIIFADEFSEKELKEIERKVINDFWKKEITDNLKLLTKYKDEISKNSEKLSKDSSLQKRIASFFQDYDKVSGEIIEQIDKVSSLKQAVPLVNKSRESLKESGELNQTLAKEVVRETDKLEHKSLIEEFFE